MMDPAVMKLCNIFTFPMLHLLVGAAFATQPQSPPIPAPASEAKVDKPQKAETDLKSIATAIMAYKMNAGFYPSTAQGLQALVEKPATDPVPRRWAQLVAKLPTDPWKSPYRYRFPGVKDPKKFEVISDGPDRTPGTPDDLMYQEQ
jgi:type II secretion system protein G